MASQIVKQLRHPKEKLRGVIMLVVAMLGWALIILDFVEETTDRNLGTLILFVFYIAIITIIRMMSAALFRAYAMGNQVLLTEAQFPRLHRMVQEGAVELGMARTPTAFLYNSHGLINAYARRLFGGRYVFLTSALVDVDTDAQVRFVVGHELGHHAAGHLDVLMSLVKLPGHFVPVLWPAYSRARELTCDRLGAHLAHDPEAARSALQMLACGCLRLNAEMNVGAFAAQEDRVPAIAGFFVNLFASHPRTTRRVRELDRSYAAAILSADGVSPGSDSAVPAE
jgi:Zn-dependent protease with chaperone function